MDRASKIKNALTMWLCALIVTLSLGETRAENFFATPSLELEQNQPQTQASTREITFAYGYDASGYALAPKRLASTGSENVNAGSALRSKLSALENAQKTATRTRTLPDGRVRYYGAETAASKPGATRGASYVTEHNPQTGQVRSWMETYNHSGNVNRVHPKMNNGQQLNSQHYPPTASELGQ